MLSFVHVTIAGSGRGGATGADRRVIGASYAMLNIRSPEHSRPGGKVVAMRFILNLIWLVLAGFWMAIAYVLAGLLAFALIITIPFGIAAFRIAGHALWPFGWTAVRKTNAGIASTIGNIVWIVLFGWWLAAGHLLTGIAMCVTIIGIPLGVANFKMIPLSLFPLGAEIVPSDSPAAAERGLF
jgi:uncharacterized membrane protein YccF (DUF307 family)